MEVGLIGLGIMGASMASNLIKAGYELVVHDIKRDAAAPPRKAGAVWADTPRQVAEATEVVLTSLPGPPEMESVALGEDGLLSGMAKGKVYFDLTTNSPAVVRTGARTANPALGVGGDEPVFLKYKPVLDAIGDQPVHVGPIGAGSVTKLVHNCAGYAIQTALAEVFTLGVKAGGETPA